MTKAEILSEIKLAEDEAKDSVSKANAARNQKIIEAKEKAREVLKSAEEEAAQFYTSQINRTKEETKKEKETLIIKGYQEAEEIKSKAKTNIPKATQFILTEFERAANA